MLAGYGPDGLFRQGAGRAESKPKPASKRRSSDATPRGSLLRWIAPTTPDIHLEEKLAMARIPSAARFVRRGVFPGLEISRVALEATEVTNGLPEWAS